MENAAAILTGIEIEKKMNEMCREGWGNSSKGLRAQRTAYLAELSVKSPPLTVVAVVASSFSLLFLLPVNGTVS